MHLILLAAGQGKRLPKKFRNKPKCMTLVKNKTILEHNKKFIQKFKFRTIVTGYKSQKIKEFIKEFKLKQIHSKDYYKTNMVHSLFKVNKIESNFVMICYGDIIFDNKIYNDLNKNKFQNFMPIKENWLDVWKGRMKMRKIYIDAEDIVVKKGFIISLGGKLKNSLPKYQYMGLLKLKTKDFFKLKIFYKKLNNKKIDLTSFINLALLDKVIKIKALVTKKYWFEIDNQKDKIFTESKI